MRSFRDMPEELVVQVCEEFLADRAQLEPNTRAGAERVGRAAQRSGQAICSDLNARWKEAGKGWEISREDLYSVLGEAWRRGLFSVTPRPQDALQKKLGIAYELPSDVRDRIRVVATESPLPDHVANHTAQVILDLLRDFKRRGKSRVHLGLGAGWTTRVVAYHLAMLLREERSDMPNLTLHAISPGFAVDHTRTAPVGFFGFFERVMPEFEGIRSEIEWVGLFGPPFAACREYAAVTRQPGVIEAFERKQQIDLVVTSLASAADVHGGLLRSVGRNSKPALKALEKARWLGDVQHRPFNAAGPILEKHGNRAVALFELDELVELAQQPDKAVVLVSPICGGCGYTRAQALVPLLRNPKLKLWSHLITDLHTARELLDLAEDPQAPRRRAAASNLGGLSWSE